MTDKEFNEQYSALTEGIQTRIQDLPPEYAKTSLRLYLENIKEIFINLPVEELTERFAKMLIDNPDKDTKIVKQPKSTHAEYHLSPIDKLSKAILSSNPKVDFKDFFDTENPLNVITGKKISVSAILRYEDLPETLQDKLPTRRTRAVHDAMLSLIHGGNKIIKLQDIAFVLNGYRSDRKATEDFLKQIESEVDWLIHTWAKINATKEANARGYDFKEINFNRPLIPGGDVTVITKKGERVKAYEIWAEPVLYSYATQKRQVITVDIDLLVLPDKLNLTFDNIILRNYLIEQIEGMSHGQIGCVILYETLYEVLGIQDTSRTEKKRVRDTVKLLLDNWKEKEYIKDYFEEPQQAGVAKRNIVIVPVKRKKLKE